MIGFRIQVFVCLIAAATATALASHEGASQRLLPLDNPLIQYPGEKRQDPVSVLQQRIASGETNLRKDPVFGYIPAILEALGIRVSSQVLVFSKTSFQSPKISPRMPRAIYFSDDAYVGYVRGGEYAEVVSIDPKQGPVFYTLEQDSSAAKHFEQQTQQCLQCHYSAVTAGVPGLLVRSVVVDRSGNQILRARSYVTDHRSPLNERWGGWFVTGTHGHEEHMGDSIQVLT